MMSEERQKNGFLGPLIFSRNYLHGKSWVIYLIVAASAGSMATRLLVPIYIGLAVDAVQAYSMTDLTSYAILILFVSVISGFLQFSVNYGSQYVSQTYAYNLRRKVFSYLISKKFSFYESQTSGDLLSRSTMDIEASRNFVVATLSQMIPTFMMIGISFYLLFTLNLSFALIFLATVPVLVILGIRVQRLQRPHWRSIRKYYGDMNENLQENIVGQRVVRGFSLETKEIDKFRETTGHYFNEYEETARIRGVYNNLMPLVVSFATAAIILYGGYTITGTTHDVGALVSVVTIFGLIAVPISSIGRLIVFSENANAGIERIGLITSASDLEDLGGKREGLGIKVLALQDIHYSKGGRKILSGVNMEIFAGEFAAITGKTASGKSTLLGLMQRLYEPDSGSISIDGKDIRDMPLTVLRRTLSVVPQEINILSGTLRENIVLGAENVSEDEVRRAAAIAGISDFIGSLPDGYDTMVGERGITLSGGQKQRVGIARAVLGSPSVLILDDATSSVDTETELKIVQNIRREMGRTAVIFVTLRNSLLSFADTVYDLSSGKLTRRVAVPDDSAEAPGEDGGASGGDFTAGNL